MKKRSSGKAHQFGGDWTSKKLDIIANYLTSYTTALKNQPFATMYVDAFAGTGYRADKASERTALADDTPLIFPEIVEPETQRLLDGSARIALNTEPPRRLGAHSPQHRASILEVRFHRSQRRALRRARAP
ncbi:MAG TPA: three-Cys-motif partner protein TcmP [Thermoanaerobaculia bacterium]|nr:three-Cys-motif partner protein TcmP [Thermoanaerobaculia bacterium]